MCGLIWYELMRRHKRRVALRVLWKNQGQQRRNFRDEFLEWLLQADDFLFSSSIQTHLFIPACSRNELNILRIISYWKRLKPTFVQTGFTSLYSCKQVWLYCHYFLFCKSSITAKVLCQWSFTGFSTLDFKAHSVYFQTLKSHIVRCWIKRWYIDNNL